MLKKIINSQIDYNTENNNLKSFDEAIKNKQEDELKRDKIVNNLEKLIINNKDKKCFSINLDGKWGEGKTSILNLLKQKEDIKNNYCLFDFNPWNLSCEKSIIKAFYEQLENNFSSSKYLKNFFTNNQEKLFFGFELFFKKSLEQTKKDFKKELAGEKPLLIFIDDLDRISQKEKILEVFKIFGEFQEFGNIIFIFAFDQGTIENVLEQEFKNDSNFLEKTINISIKIYTDPNLIYDYFLKELKEIIKDKKKIEAIENLINGQDYSINYEIN